MPRVAAIALLLLLAGIAVVAAARTGEDDGAQAAVETGSVHGVLVEVGEQDMTIMSADGSGPQQFRVRPQERRSLDLFHLGVEHVRQRLPVVLHWAATEDEPRYVIRVDDA